MTPLRIKRSRQAQADRLDIWVRIAVDSVASADRIADRLDEAVAMLADYPNAGPLRPNLGHGTRIHPVDNLVIFYRIKPDSIEVIRILHAARDITPGMLDD